MIKNLFHKTKNLFSLEKIEHGNCNYFWSMLALILGPCGILLTLSSSTIYNIYGDSVYSINNDLIKNVNEIGYIFLTTVVLTPIIEEIFYRLFLTKKIWLQYIGINLFGLLLGWTSSLFVFVLSTYKLKYSKSPIDGLSHKAILFSSLIFGYRHLGNFPNNGNLGFFGYLLVGGVLILPFFVLGVLLSYTRVRLGIQYSILLHAIINSIAVISFSLMFLSPYIGEFGMSVIGYTSVFIFEILPFLFIFTPWFCRYQTISNN